MKRTSLKIFCLAVESSIMKKGLPLNFNKTHKMSYKYNHHVYSATAQHNRSMFWSSGSLDRGQATLFFLGLSLIMSYESLISNFKLFVYVIIKYVFSNNFLSSIPFTCHTVIHCFHFQTAYSLVYYFE